MPARATPPRYRLWFLGGGLALFVYVLIRLNPAEVFSLLLRIQWNFLWITLLYVGHQAARTFALSRCLLGGRRASWWELAKIRLSGEAVQFLTLTGPFLAEPAKALLLKRQGIQTTQAFAATLAEFLIYTFTSAAFSIAGLLYLRKHFLLEGPIATGVQALAYAMTGFLAVAAVAIVFRVYLIGTILKGIQGLPAVGKYLRLDQRQVRASEDIVLLVLRDRLLLFLQVVLIEVSAQLLMVWELVVFLRGVGEPFVTIHPFLLEAVTKFIGFAFFFIPGQVGASEGVYAVAFEQVGLSAAAGFALALVRRLRSMLVAGAGLVFSPLWAGSADERQKGNG